MINKVILMGRLTADPELRQTQSGISACKFSVAINRPKQKDKEQQADFINVQAWRNTAEFVCKYFKKGSMIIVEGALRNNNYTDSNGTKHYGIDVQADKVDFGESKNASNTNSQTPPSQTTNSAPPVAQPTTNETVQIGDLSYFEVLSDGDVPF